MDDAGTDDAGTDGAGTDSGGTDGAGTDGAGTDGAGTDAGGTDGDDRDDTEGGPTPADADWESALEQWTTELDGDGWVTVAEAEAATGVSRSALRSWYRKGAVPSRVDDGPHGPQRLVQLEAVLDRVARSPRLGRRPAGAVPAAPVAPPEDGLRALVDLLAAQIERAEARAERAEGALRQALARAAAAEAERDMLLPRAGAGRSEGDDHPVTDEPSRGLGGNED